MIINSNGEAVGKRALVPVADFVEPCPLPIVGDVRIEVVSKDGKKDDELFHFWFNAGMLEGRANNADFERLVRRKWLLDGLRDRKHKKYDAHFRVELTLSQAAPTPAPRAASGSVAAEL